MRRLGSIVSALAILAACGGGSGDGSATATTTVRRDAVGNVIKPGQDWSGVGTERSGGGTPSSDGGAGADGGEQALQCEFPTTTPEQGEAIENLPPEAREHAENPFGEPANDFPIEASIKPDKGDPGTVVKIEALAVGQPNALIVILTQFSDRDHHGMRAAKFADATGRAVLEGPTPETAPPGPATVSVSATNSTTDQSALKVLEFQVTGPGCPETERG